MYFDSGVWLILSFVLIWGLMLWVVLYILFSDDEFHDTISNKTVYGELRVHGGNGDLLFLPAEVRARMKSEQASQVYKST